MRLIVESLTEGVTWADFVGRTPGRSIALDGYVVEGPRFNPRGPWVNFNHHAGVPRLETRATCAQVLIAIRQGLIPIFSDKDGTEEARIYVNDCDEDVCLSVFLLQKYHLAEATSNSLLNRLVFMEDMIDTTGGAYLFSQNMKSLQQLLWIFAPYHQFRSSGKIHDRQAGEFRAVIDEVMVRIDRYLIGEALTVVPDTRYRKVGQSDGWTMVEELGANARLGVYADGIKAFVAVRRLPDNRFAYSLGRISQFVPFPIPKILKALNWAEDDHLNTWGGSDMIAGGPRKGSRLNPIEVTEVICKAMARKI